MGIVDLLLNTNPGWDLVKGLFNYYGLKEYLHIQFNRNAIPGKVQVIEANNKRGNFLFWEKVFNGKLIPGDYIRLENFEISPWFPRKPGQFWTTNASKARERAFQHHIENEQGGLLVFDTYGKTLLTELGGIGSVNFRKNRDTILFTATSSGTTHEGIPIICNKDLWEDIQQEINLRGKVQADLQGQLIEVPTEFDSYFLRSTNVPKIALKVSSILSIKVSNSKKEISVTPWTFFERNDNSASYSFVYITHNLFTDNMDRSVQWLRNYIYAHGGRTILTDFDEATNSLNAVFPLEQCVNGSIMDRDIIHFCQTIERRFTNGIEQ